MQCTMVFDLQPSSFPSEGTLRPTSSCCFLATQISLSSPCPKPWWLVSFNCHLLRKSEAETMASASGGPLHIFLSSRRQCSPLSRYSRLASRLVTRSMIWWSYTLLICVERQHLVDVAGHPVPSCSRNVLPPLTSQAQLPH